MNVDEFKKSISFLPHRNKIVFFQRYFSISVFCKWIRNGLVSMNIKSFSFFVFSLMLRALHSLKGEKLSSCFKPVSSHTKSLTFTEQTLLSHQEPKETSAFRKASCSWGLKKYFINKKWSNLDDLRCWYSIGHLLASIHVIPSNKVILSISFLVQRFTFIFPSWF